MTKSSRGILGGDQTVSLGSEKINPNHVLAVRFVQDQKIILGECHVSAIENVRANLAESVAFHLGSIVRTHPRTRSTGNFPHVITPIRFVGDEIFSHCAATQQTTYISFPSIDITTPRVRMHRYDSFAPQRLYTPVYWYYPSLPDTAAPNAEIINRMQEYRDVVTTLDNLERGRNAPPLNTARRIAATVVHFAEAAYRQSEFYDPTVPSRLSLGSLPVQFPQT